MLSRAQKDDALARIRAAGVVGAGGSGFPTHVKLGASCDTVIANGAECEPLLEKDRYVMELRTERLVEGVARAAALVGAKRKVIALKTKRGPLLEQLKKAVRGHRGMEVAGLADTYPSGDEFVLVNDVAGRRPPPGGFPTEVGVLVQNVETLVNIAGALAGEPVTETWLTVCGAVREPFTAAVPIGTPAGELLAQAGGYVGAGTPANRTSGGWTGITAPGARGAGANRASSAGDGSWVCLEGGAMMGRPFRDPAHPVTKTTAALLFLPPSHRAVAFATDPEPRKRAVGRSACDQCMYCTQFCPRFLLGYALEPHRVMRGLGFGGARKTDFDPWGLLCCECGVCDLYACPEDLSPRDACRWAKRAAREMAAGGAGSASAQLAPPPDRGGAHSLRLGRLIPLAMLKQRLDLRRYDRGAPFREVAPLPEALTVLHKQHAGAPGRARLAVGSTVARGEVVAEVGEKALGVAVHAPCAGVVTSVTADATEIRRQ